MRIPASIAVLSTFASVACSAAVSSKHPSMLTGSERASLLLTAGDADYPAGCAVSLTRPPTLDELVDSTSFLSAVAKAWPDNRSGAVVLTISVDSTGALQWMKVLEANPAGPGADEIVKSLQMPYKPRPGVEGSRSTGWSYRFRITGGPERTVEVGHTIGCRPALMNREALARRMQAEVEKHGPALGAYIEGTRRARVWVKIDSVGRPKTIQVNRSSGYLELDRIATQIASIGLFNAATVDGRAVEVWIELPMSFNYPEPTAPSRRGR